MTPAIEGIKSTINTPAGGWKADTWYIATVATNEDNMFHRTLIYVSTTGEAYVINPGYENEMRPVSQLYVVRSIEEKGTLTNLIKPDPVKLTERTYYVAHISINEEPAQTGLAFTGFLNGDNEQPGGYSIVALPGSTPTIYPYKAATVELISKIITEDELEND